MAAERTLLPSQNTNADTITAVATRSAQTGLRKAWI